MRKVKPWLPTRKSATAKMEHRTYFALPFLRVISHRSEKLFFDFQLTAAPSCPYIIEEKSNKKLKYSIKFSIRGKKLTVKKCFNVYLKNISN